MSFVNLIVKAIILIASWEEGGSNRKYRRTSPILSTVPEETKICADDCSKEEKERPSRQAAIVDSGLEEDGCSEGATGEDGGVHWPSQEEPSDQGGSSFIEPESGVDLAPKTAHHRQDKHCVVPVYYFIVEN